MHVAVTADSMIVADDMAEESSAVDNFFLARQPILDRKQSLAAYELLFRDATTGAAHFASDLAATASVISHTTHLGLERVIGDVLGFVNVDEAALMSDIFEVLPRERVVLELIETMPVTPSVLARVDELVHDGFRFALDDVIVNSPDIRRLLPLIDIIKIDINGMTSGTLATLTADFKQYGKKLLAEKVETTEQFHSCDQLGYDYFQGYYFARPVIMKGKKLSPSQLAITNLMTLVMSDADSIEIEGAIKHDASIALNLLRLVNSAGICPGRRIRSLSQALLILGRTQLRRWLQILLYVEPSGGNASGVTPLLAQAATRGKLLELMATKAEPGQRDVTDTAFTVGIMSLMDTLFHMPMADLLDQIAVVGEVSDALLRRGGRYGQMLKLAEHLEHVERAAPLLPPTMGRLRLSSEDLLEIAFAAYEWSNDICCSITQDGP